MSALKLACASDRQSSFASLLTNPIEDEYPAAVYCRSSYLLQRPSPSFTRLSS